jgi:PAS domain S-box-containing protein
MNESIHGEGTASEPQVRSSSVAHSIEVPYEIIRKWQEFVNLLAEIMHVPSASIMRVDPPHIRVFVSSTSEGNPCEPGALDTGPYCETVMKTGQPLLVPDARENEAWKANPHVRLGMISYLGVPIGWPDGRLFGTICVRDNKRNEYSEAYLKLMLHFRDMLQTDLKSFATWHSQLEQHEAKIRRLVDANIIGIIIWDLEGRILEANDAFLRMGGYDREDLISGRLNRTDLTPPEWRERDARTDAELKMIGAVQPFEKEYFRKDGGRVPVLIGLAAFGEERDQGVAFVLDLTERKRAEEALMRSEAYLAEAQKLTHTGSWAWDPRTEKVLYCSKEMFRIFGLDPRTSLPSRDNFRQQIHPEDRDWVKKRFEESLRERVDTFAEYRVLLPDGTVRHINASGHPVLNEDGELTEFVGTAVDVTERKRTEGALRESEAKIRRLVDSNIIGIFVWDLEGRIIEANEAFLRMVGYDREDIVSGRMRWPNLTPAELHASDERTLAELKATGTVQPCEREYLRKDGRRVPVLMGSTLFEETGNEGLAFVLDLTERKRAEQALLESELKLREIIETVPGLVWSNGPDGKPTHINQHFLDYSGMAFEEFGHRGWEAVVHPAELPETAEAFYHAIQTGTSYQGVMRLRRADGEFRWHHARGEPLRDREGNIVQWYGLAVDIDERKKAEDRLRRSEAYLAEAERLSHSGSAAYNETEILYMSEEAHRMFGFDPLQGIQRREAVWKRIHPDDLDATNETIERAVREKRSFNNEFRIILPNGTIRHVEAINHPVFSASGELVEIIVTGIDVTERKRADDALRESEAKIRRLVDANIIGIFIWDFDGRILEANEAFLDIVGYDHEDLVAGRIRWTDLTPPEWRDRDTRLIQEHKVIGTLQPFEKEYFRKDGSHVPVLIGVATFEEGGNQGVAFVIDLTERKRAEEALRESEAKFRDYAESASDWYWETDPDHKFARVTDYEQLLARGFAPVSRIGLARWEFATDVESEPEKWELHRSMLEARQPFRDFVYRAVRTDGSLVYYKISGKPVFDANGEFRGYRGTGADVTALRTVEAEARENERRYRETQLELAHANRLATMGQLTASIAHEVKQPIAAARNNAHAALNFLNKQPPDMDEVREALGCIVGDSDRAGGIIDRIRDHIKKAPPQDNRFDLNAAINEVIRLAQTAITENGVSVQTRLTESMYPVRGDRVQVQQVVLNLILNAVEAMGSVAAGARELSVSTEQSQTNDILVAVRDSGPGIDPEHLDRVFEAFYTTKSGGMGMGLSICRSIIDAHGGRLWAEADEPRGAIFKFTIPSAEGNS